MRSGTPLALLLICGCVLPGTPRPDGLTTSLKPSAGPDGSDAVGLEVAVLEVPAGDRYVNGGLWESIDEQAVALDRKAALDDNGFRIALVGGMRPSEFDNLLKSSRSNPNGHWMQMRAGHGKVVPFGEPRATCEFRIVLDGKPGPVTTIEKARCAIQITPRPATEGGTTLAFAPQVQHGSRPVWLAPISGDDLEMPADKFPTLSWEVTVQDGEFAIVGTWFEKTDTLGHACFVDTDGAKPVQRLLAVRAVRPGNQ